MRVTWFVIAAAFALGVALVPHEPDAVRREFVCTGPPTPADAMATIENRIEVLDGQIAAAVTKVVEAEHDDERAVARAALDQLRRQRDDLRRQADQLRAAIVAMHEHVEPHLPAGCLDNPLALGCN